MYWRITVRKESEKLNCHMIFTDFPMPCGGAIVENAVNLLE
jgi:hypothetical protein